MTSEKGIKIFRESHYNGGYLMTWGASSAYVMASLVQMERRHNSVKYTEISDNCRKSN